MKNSAAVRVNQVPEGYLLVGVDPHKKMHAAVAMTRDYTSRSRLKFSNSVDGFEKALRWAGYETERNGCSGMMFAIETAGHYWRNFAYYLDEHGVLFRQINQFTLKRRREGKDNNKRKNDFRDAEVAAQLLCSGEFSDGKLPYSVYAELRAAYSAYRRLRQEMTRLINRTKTLLDGLFPEFPQVFKDVCGMTALSVLKACPVPGVIAAMTEEEFIAAIRASHQGRLMKKKLAALHYVARSSSGIKSGVEAVALELSFMVDKQRLTEYQIRQLEPVLRNLVDQTEEAPYLLSIRGLNYISVAGWLAETGPFRNYSSAKQMIKLTGSNPIQSESAGKSRSLTPMSKKGRAVLRCCLWMAITPVLRHNPEFHDWAEQRRERPANANPLHRREAAGAALNRLIRIGFALVRDRCLYRVGELAGVYS